MKCITIVVYALLIFTVFSLTAQEVSNYCHCDLTASFCDFNCCCDKDCSATITTDCFNRFSTIFCLNTSYYYKVDPTLSQTTTPNCYYYNQSTTLQEQVTISARQLTQIAANFQKVTPLASTQAAMYISYKLGDSITIGNKNAFDFIDATTGNCLSGVGTIPFKILWRVNSDFTCIGTSNSINMFTDIFNKIVNSFASFTDRQVTIPSPTTQYNQAIVYFFIGRFGSNSVQFVQDVRVVGRVAGNTALRYLKIRFIDPQVDLEQQQSQPSFFPQIPYDIFYPIYQIAYSY